MMSSASKSMSNSSFVSGDSDKDGSEYEAPPTTDAHLQRQNSSQLFGNDGTPAAATNDNNETNGAIMTSSTSSQPHNQRTSIKSEAEFVQIAK
jgi:hypothetical protein